jgi:hypothetical protein
LFEVFRKKSARGMLGCNPVLVVGTMTKFCVNGTEDLLRSRWTLGKSEAICIVIVILVEHGVLGIRGYG